MPVPKFAVVVPRSVFKDHELNYFAIQLIERLAKS